MPPAHAVAFPGAGARLELELVARVMREFPRLTVAELSQALLQVGPIDGPAMRKELLARVRALLQLAFRHAG